MKRLQSAIVLAAIGLGLLSVSWTQAQQSIRLFGTLSNGQSKAVLVNSSGSMAVGAASASAGQFPTLLTSGYTQLCTAANLTETALFTYTLPGGTLATDGQAIRLTTWGLFGATANTKNIRVYFGATSVLFTTTANALAWRESYTLIRTGATTQIMLGDGGVDLGGANTIIRVSTPAETLSGNVTVQMTGQNGTAAANDICFRAATLEFLK